MVILRKIRSAFELGDYLLYLLFEFFQVAAGLVVASVCEELVDHLGADCLASAMDESLQLEEFRVDGGDVSGVGADHVSDDCSVGQ